MSFRRSFAVLLALALTACGGGAAQVASQAPHPAARAPARHETSSGAGRAPASSTQRAARPVAGNELAVPPDERFAVTRQVTALERAIELYEAFIQRAGDDPEYADAVRRSRDRIEDARLTICFLLEKPCDDSKRHSR